VAKFDLEIIVKLRNEAQKAIGDLNTGLVGLGKGAAVAAAGGIAAIGAGLMNIGDQVSTARTVLQGLNDVDMTAVLDDAQLLARRYGTDVTQVFTATRTLMEEFGLTSAEATDLIAAGFSRGLDTSGDFLDSVGEYSNLFADNGASATEFFSILDSGLAGGVLGTDKAADAFKEFGIRLSELTSGEGQVLSMSVIGGEPGEIADRFVSDLESALYFTDLSDQVKVNLYEGLLSGAIDTADAFKIIMPALAAIESEVERNAAGVQLFGTQWEDLGSEAMTALTLAGDSLSTLGDVADTERATIQSLGEVPALIFDKFSLALLPVSDLILGVVNAVISAEDPLATLIDKVVELIPGFETFAGEGAKISRQLQPFITLVKDNLLPILIGLTAVIGVALVAAFVAIVAPIAKIVLVTGLFMTALFAAVVAVQKFWTEISTTFPEVQDVVDMVMREVQVTIESVMRLINVIVSEALKVLQKFWKDNGDAITRTVVAAFTGIGRVLQNAMQQIRAVVNTVLALIRGDWSAFSDGLKRITELFVRGQQLAFELLWTILGPIVTYIKNGIINAISDAWNGIKPYLDSIRTGIINAISNAWNGITGTLATIRQGIIDAISNAWNGISGTLATIRQGIIDALRNAWNGIRDTLISIRQGIIDALRNAWNGISGTLATIRQGIVNAIRDAVDGIATPLNSIRQKIIDAMESVKTFLRNTFSWGDTAVRIGEALMNAISSAIRNGVTAMANALRGVLNAALNALPQPIRDALGAIGIGTRSAVIMTPAPSVSRSADLVGGIATLPERAGVVVNITVGSVRDQRDIDAIERAVTRSMNEAARRGIVQSQLPRGI
jgi:phage-related minor tail protein